MAKEKLRKKVDLLSEALNGNITEHHRFLLRMHLDNIEFHAKQIKRLDEEIQRRMIPFQIESRLIQTIPGISEVSAREILAEIGVDMKQFPDEAHLSSWAGICPGNNESAGKIKSGRTRKGNSFLKAALTEAVWAAVRSKDSAYQAIYHNIAKRRGKKRALVAIAHHMLIDVYRVLNMGEPYQDIGSEAVFSRASKKRDQAMIRTLERSGYVITKATVV
jgi:transposase